MRETKVMLAIVLLLIAHTGLAQENVQTRIPNSLTECYQMAALNERDNRLPSNINMLIELIRKVEDTPGFNTDMRQFSASLVHRFRMDGIERAPGVFQPSVLPFSPSGFQFSRHRLLLARLLPGNAANFPNATLTASERCALHFMMSSSVDRTVRNDEATVCNQLSQYRAMRIPRGKEVPIRKRRSVATKNNFLGDVEILDELNEYHSRKSKKSGRYMAEEGEEGGDIAEEAPADAVPADEGEAMADELDDELVDGDARLDTIDINNANALSQCPVENGVVRTLWGAVAGGPLLAGVAAGLEHQIVTTRELLALSRSQGQFEQQTQAFSVDNRWAATLSGDLAEVALLQGPVTTQVQVGGSGGWNSTTIPRWHFLSQRDRLEMTDAEIRGGLDGLILALNVAEYRTRAPQMRLSQLLDMYYSHRGVFSTNVRSCDRRTLFTEVAPLNIMQAQTTGFSAVLDREMQLRVTLPHDAIQTFSNAAAQALSTYIPQSLNDLTCASTSVIVNDPTIWRTSTQIFIYVDVGWTHREVQPVIAQLLENLDVNRFGTSYTLMNANDASIIVNTTSTLSEFYMQWTNAVHLLQPQGLSLPNILRSVRNLTRDIMDLERAQSAVGGQSMVALIIPQLSPVSQADITFAMQETLFIREEVPDLALLFLTGGNVNRFSQFVREPSRDLFPLQVTGAITDTVAAQVNPVIQRIQQVPRRVINHRCGSNWQNNNEWGGNTVNQYVERGGVNFYRVHPNYFFGQGENQRIRIAGHGYATITVCSSRLIERPRQNQSTTENDINCQQLQTNQMEIMLNNACNDHWLIMHCPPLFITVEGTSSVAEDITFRCNDPECRFPDNLRFSITAENLGCFSGAAQMTATITLVMLLLLVVFQH